MSAQRNIINDSTIHLIKKVLHNKNLLIFLKSSFLVELFSPKKTRKIKAYNNKLAFQSIKLYYCMVKKLNHLKDQTD